MKKFLSIMFIFCSIFCLGFNLTACGGSEEKDPIKYAQKILDNYGTDYDYVYTYQPRDEEGFENGWDADCYVSREANKTTVVRTQMKYDSDTKGASVVDYLEFIPDGENVTILHYNVNDLTYTSETLTQSMFEKTYPYLIENALKAFINFDPDNLGFESEDPYFKNEESRNISIEYGDSSVRIENTCQYYVGAIPTESERDKYNPNPDPAFKGTDVLGATMTINKKNKQIMSMSANYTSYNFNIEYSYNQGTKSVNTKYFGTTKKEALNKIVQDMTINAPTGNYKLEGTMKYNSETEPYLSIYDHTKNMSKTISQDSVVYQKFEVNENAGENEIYVTITNYIEDGYKIDRRTYTRSEYMAISSNYYALNFGANIDIENYTDEDISLTHNEDDQTTVITLTHGEDEITITFNSENDFIVKQTTQYSTIFYTYVNHNLTNMKTVSEVYGNYTTVDVNYTYDNVEGFEFDESLYS